MLPFFSVVICANIFPGTNPRDVPMFMRNCETNVTGKIASFCLNLLKMQTPAVQGFDVVASSLVPFFSVTDARAVLEPQLPGDLAQSFRNPAPSLWRIRFSGIESAGWIKNTALADHSFSLFCSLSPYYRLKKGSSTSGSISHAQRHHQRFRHSTRM